MVIAERLITVEEFAELPEDGRPCELVRGRIVWMNPPKPTHGYVCGNIVGLYQQHVRAKRLGRILCNDSGVVTERNPDTVRGADVAFFSYQRLPKGRLPASYPAVVPELVFEVLSPDDRWSAVLEKIAEYLNAGVLVACVVDPATEKVHVYRCDRETEMVASGGKLAIPEIFPRFSVRVKEIFE